MPKFGFWRINTVNRSFAEASVAGGADAMMRAPTEGLASVPVVGLGVLRACCWGLRGNGCGAYFLSRAEAKLYGWMGR